MSDTPSFREEYVSQIPALQLLTQLGYRYLTPDEALKLRGNSKANLLLTSVLRDWLRDHNKITYKGQQLSFSESNIELAIQQLQDENSGGLGLVRTSEKLYERLTLGTTLTQTIDGDTRSFSLHYIDWQHPENNVYHVSDEFEVTRVRNQQTRRPDIICFVNGIPLVVIECKRPDKMSPNQDNPVFEAVSQMIRNQMEDEIPQLFVFAQLLLAVHTNQLLYATTATPLKFWSFWKEEEGEQLETQIHQAINAPLSDEEKDHLYDHRDHPWFIRAHFDKLAASGERVTTEQDRILYALLRPARLLELIYKFTLYDGGVKKIARYQQYFAVKATLARIGYLTSEGKRNGGIIWHTTGSGKSLTMVMLAKSLSLHPALRNPKVILVTDRVDLDDQLYGTFKACGKAVEKATSGRDLIKLISSTQVDIIATVIDKFDTVANEKVVVDHPDIFVLVDESHRSQYGQIHARMRGVFRKACYIGFTGTPLLKKEKSTIAKFGDFIHKYPMRQAVADKAVVPLLYEGRLAELEPDQKSIDNWFERVTRDLNDEQKLDLKRKFSRQGEVNKADQRIQQIAFDIGQHFVANFQGTGLKAQLAAPSKLIALRYKEYLDEFGDVSSEVVISAPDTREGNTDLDEANLPKVTAFWNKMLAKYGTEEDYNREVKASFAREDGIELLIVVDKLLTGFDEPRNTVLYIDKPLKEHGLLQAIARVNRVYNEQKPYGYILDYRGVLGELNKAINTYDALMSFDSEDVAGTLVDISLVIKDLPQLHANLWAIFQLVPNKMDVEQLQRFLEPEDIRQEFYDALGSYAGVLQIALSTTSFYEQTPEAQIERYKRDLAFFTNLRNSVKNRYGETIRYGEFEERIRKLMDKHIAAHEITLVTPQVNIFDSDAFLAEVEKVEGSAARADTIAHQMKRTISERMAEDPVFYKKFSTLIEETIAEYKQGRINEAEYLSRMQEQYESFSQGKNDTIPSSLRPYKHAAAYYGLFSESLATHFAERSDSADTLAAIAMRSEELIERNKIRDWVHNADVALEMANDLDDYFHSAQQQYGFTLTNDEIESLLERLIHLAKQRDHL